MHKKTPAIILVLAAIAASPSLADETPRTGVIDDAGVMSASAKNELNERLLELEQKTGAQFKVWTMLSTKGEDLYSLAIKKARAWRLGQKEKNNGCLLAIAVKDRKWRVVTGEGIEDVLPDILCEQIVSQYMLPNFRTGDFSKGILLAASAMAGAIAKKSNVALSGAPALPTRSPRYDNSTSAPCALGFFFFIALLVIVGSAARRRRRYYGHWGGGFWDALFWSSILNNMGGRGGGSGWGGWSSGDSGGGFGGGGGFSDGGGGSFGGGGAGGSW